MDVCSDNQRVVRTKAGLHGQGVGRARAGRMCMGHTGRGRNGLGSCDNWAMVLG